MLATMSYYVSHLDQDDSNAIARKIQEIMTNNLRFLAPSYKNGDSEKLLISHNNSLPAGDGPRTPSNIWMVPEEEAIKVHWTPPTDTNSRLCVLEYRQKGVQRSTNVPVTKDEGWFLLSGLKRDTLYKVRLYCMYPGTAGPPTIWIAVSTRTVSVKPEICSGSLPHASLEPHCLRDPKQTLCDFTCNDGYRASDAEDVMFGYRHSNRSRHRDVLCVDGIWVTYLVDDGMGITDLCLPEADFHKCPLFIPNGDLEPHCGPATDWLCQFSCNNGFNKHTYMWGRLKWFQDKKFNLLCQDGVWKTGYEDIGLDVSAVCVAKDTKQCLEEIPNMAMRTPCWSGHSCRFDCNEGFHRHPMALDSLECADGKFYLHTTKYDHSITPQTVCVPDGSETECSRSIAHGHVPDGCNVDCEPVCDEGYSWPNKFHRYPLTCEDGHWYTSEYAYNGDNICFPNGEHICPLKIPNGEVSHYYNHDRENSRKYLNNPWCDPGFRKHRVLLLECIAGQWKSGQERFGLDVSAMCVPETSESTWFMPDYFKNRKD